MIKECFNSKDFTFDLIKLGKLGKKAIVIEEAAAEHLKWQGNLKFLVDTRGLIWKISIQTISKLVFILLFVKAFQRIFIENGAKWLGLIKILDFPL